MWQWPLRLCVQVGGLREMGEPARNALNVDLPAPWALPPSGLQRRASSEIHRREYDPWSRSTLL